MDNYRSIPGIVASGTVSQYKAVQLDTSADRTVKAMSNANAERPIGVLQNDPLTTEAADVAYDGVCKMEYGGTITCGDPIAVNNDGEAITDAEVTAQDGADLHHIGFALESGVDGDIRQVLLHSPNIVGKE